MHNFFLIYCISGSRARIGFVFNKWKNITFAFCFFPSSTLKTLSNIIKYLLHNEMVNSNTENMWQLLDFQQRKKITQIQHKKK